MFIASHSQAMSQNRHDPDSPPAIDTTARRGAQDMTDMPQNVK